MSFLVSYFGVIVGDLIPEEDLAWELYLYLYEIIDLVLSCEISEDDITHLCQLIKSHNEIYVEISAEYLKPKFHFLTHYPQCIRI